MRHTTEVMANKRLVVNPTRKKNYLVQIKPPGRSNEILAKWISELSPECDNNHNIQSIKHIVDCPI